MKEEKILIALSKPRIAQEVQRHLKEENYHGFLFAETNGISLNEIDVIIIDDLQHDKNQKILNELRTNNLNCEIIIFSFTRDRDYIAEISKRFRIFRILPQNWTPLSIKFAIYHALKRSEIRRAARTLELTNVSRDKVLESLVRQLDQKICDPTMGIDEMREDITDINRKMSLITHLVFETRKCETLLQVLNLLRKELHGVIPFDNILWGDTGDNETIAIIKKEYGSSIALPLVAEEKCLGHLYFVAKDRGTFANATESLDILAQVADATTLALQRINLIAIAKVAKRAWESTFDSIDSPLVIVDKNFSIVKMNSAYRKLVNYNASLNGDMPCFKLLAGRDSQCHTCPIKSIEKDGGNSGSEIKLSHSKELLAWAYDINVNEQKVVIYKDVTEQKILRSKLFNAAQLAEVGMLVSSIMQELMDPLRRVLLLSEKIFGKLDEVDPRIEDILALEASTKQCLEISKKLVGFSKNKEMGKINYKPEATT